MITAQLLSTWIAHTGDEYLFCYMCIPRQSVVFVQQPGMPAAGALSRLE